MHESSADLARSITWKGSKQTYITGRMVIDRDLADDFFRAYAYFRWADDVIDTSSNSDEERIAFIKQQRELIDKLYNNERPNDLTPEEDILADLISHDRSEDSGLHSFIRNMFAIIEFDAYRKGWSIGREELEWYSNCLSKSVTDGIQYFIGNGYLYPDGDNRYSAATGAHIAHLLRDTVQDTADGFINIPAEYLEMHDLKSENLDSPPYRAWVRSRVEQARLNMQDGKRYLDELDVLRCKIAGYWYCTRFEGVLDTIEREDYRLRSHYNERGKLATWLKVGWLAVTITVRHVTRRTAHRDPSRRDPSHRDPSRRDHRHRNLEK
ncbi:MAG TPA: squalene/phytoene synthase family protein [Anaerolineae bacterium]|jgi:phytoene/squalene synthetase|nr:squalene/phytoene synthase family protein [Anaerolineae bacterium]